jgi:uncharacterized protein (TIGR02679 family)
MAIDHDRLARLLGGPEHAWLVDRVRRRVADGRALDGVVTLARATPEQRRAVAVLLGRPAAAGRSLTVPLAEVDRVLRESGACPDGLAAAVSALTGPVPDRRADATREAAAWAEALAPLDSLAADRPDLAPWCRQVAATGLVKRLAKADPDRAGQLTTTAVAVLRRLPAVGLTLPVLAARTTGDAHALDDGNPLAALVFSGVRALAALSSPLSTDHPAAGAEARRAAWASVGVALDELSSRVLVLGLPGSPASALGRMLAAACESGEPSVLTLRQLRRDQAPLGVGGREVFVCENPAVLAAAADELGPDCPPLICVEGNISVAARTLLIRLAAQGGSFAYHGDFDWGGARIAASVFALVGTRPWRYDADAYLGATARGLGTPLTGGAPSDTPWDPALRAAIESQGIRIEEEHLIDQLLEDLGAAVHRRRAERSEAPDELVRLTEELGLYEDEPGGEAR